MTNEGWICQLRHGRQKEKRKAKWGRKKDRVAVNSGAAASFHKNAHLHHGIVHRYGVNVFDAADPHVGNGAADVQSAVNAWKSQ